MCCNCGDEQNFAPRSNEACSRPLSQLLNALLERKGSWTVHSGKRSSYLDKRLPRLSVLRQGLRVGTQCSRHQLHQCVARTRAEP